MQQQRAAVVGPTQVVAANAHAPQVQRAGEVHRAPRARDVAGDGGGGKRAPQVQRAGAVDLDQVGRAPRGPAASGGQ